MCFPLWLSLANCATRGHQVRFVGVERGMEAKLVPAENFPIEWIEIGGLNRVGFRQTLATLGELPFSVWQAARILDRAAPAAVFSMGGYVAGPVLLAAVWKRIPIVIMEPNAIPGFTHRHLARFVSRALVSFTEAQRWFPQGRSEVTGLPIREEFFAIPAKPQGPVVTVLITGGSQGSRTLNRAAEESWPLWDRTRVRLIHQIGSRMYSELAPKFEKSGMPGEVAEFLTDMPRAFSEADLVVGRAGMGAVSELAAAGKPSILVPLPGASDRASIEERAGVRKRRRGAFGAGPGDDRRALGGGSDTFDRDSRNVGENVHGGESLREAGSGAARSRCTRVAWPRLLTRAKQSRNNTLLKCFLNPSPFTSSASAA